MALLHTVRTKIRSVRRLLRHRAELPLPSIAVRRIADYAEYLVYLETSREEQDLRRQSERALVLRDTSFTVPGICFVCAAQVKSRVDFSYAYIVDGVNSPNWREQLRCPFCGLNNRMRAALHLLEIVGEHLASGYVYVTEQSPPMFRELHRRMNRIVGSEYLGVEVPLGAFRRGIRNEDVSQLTFAANQFDVVLSFDVLEHVPRFEAALAECHRCLRAGGMLLLTVPFSRRPETRLRATLDSRGTLHHLLPPEYHGDPLRAEGCLAFNEFGWDLLETIRDTGFAEAAALFYWSQAFGYVGNGDQVAFVATKTL